MKFYAIRHGVTQMNTEGRCNGQTVDDHLTEGGKVLLKEFVSSSAFPKDFDIIIASDLARTKETADIVNEVLKKEIKFDKRLREIDFGSLTGTLWSDLKRDRSDLFMEKYWACNYDFTPFGGEDVADVKERVFAVLSDVKEKFYDKKVLLVTHGGIVRLLELELSHVSLNAIENIGLHSFEFDL